MKKDTVDWIKLILENDSKKSEGYKSSILILTSNIINENDMLIR